MRALRSSPLRRPDFLRLWIGLLISYIGDQFTIIALLWFVLKLTGSGLAISTVLLAFALPRAAVSPLWGAWLDRFPPQRVMALDNLARAAAIAGIPLIYWLGDIQLWHIVVLAVLSGLFAPATEIGVRVLTPRIVPDSELDQANALVFSSQQWSVLIGPALAGLITATLGAPVALVIDAASFLVMAALLARIPALPQPKHDGAHRFSFMRGFKTLWDIKPARVLTALLFMLALSYFPLEPALPLFTERILRADADAYGLIWTGFGIGAALSFALIGPLTRIRHAGVIAALIAIAWGLSIFPVLFVRDLRVLMLCFGLGGLAWGPYIPMESSIIQRLIPSEQLGEVFGARSAIINLTNPLGVLLGGALLGVVSPEIVIAGSALACVIAGLLALLSRDLRQVVRA